MSNYISSWRSPSNIAIVKYWGKYGRQLPKNTSISFTLDAAHTDTTVTISPGVSHSDKVTLDFYFEGLHNPIFGQKAQSFLNGIAMEMPFILNFDWKIETKNTFPHSSGIASSASGMSALAACIVDLENQVGGKEKLSQNDFYQRVSFFARLGSGSACRSIYPKMASWGIHDHIAGSSNEFATYIGESIHDVYKSYHDDILIVSKKEKSVSSTAGHSLMENNPYAAARYNQANENVTRLLEVLKAGDVEAFGQIAEDEALTLHALMMCSQPSYILIEPDTLNMINKIRAYRVENKVPVYFTLDAGPNIHLLYPHESAHEVQAFIDSELIHMCQDQMVIRDRVGEGIQKIGINKI